MQLEKIIVSDVGDIVILVISSPTSVINIDLVDVNPF